MKAELSMEGQLGNLEAKFTLTAENAEELTALMEVVKVIIEIQKRAG